MWIFNKSRGYMGLWHGTPLASSGSAVGSSRIGTPTLNCRGGSSPMRSTTRVDPATLALFSFGAAVGFVAFLFPTSVVAAGGGELNNTLGMGANMEAVLGDGLEWDA